MIKLNTTLEATNMGENQDEIAAYVSTMPQWLAYVENVNAAGIPGDENPTDEWLDAQNFHPDDLIADACAALGWESRPSNGGLVMQFSAE